MAGSHVNKTRAFSDRWLLSCIYSKVSLSFEKLENHSEKRLSILNWPVQSVGEDSMWRLANHSRGSIHSLPYLCSLLLLLLLPNRPTLGDPMDCSTPGFPVPHRLLELAQTHVHGASDVIQPFHPLSSPSPAFSLQFCLDSLAMRKCMSSFQNPRDAKFHKPKGLLCWPALDKTYDASLRYLLIQVSCL